MSIRYHAVAWTSRRTDLLSVVEKGVYICTWNDLLLLLPQQQYIGSGYRVRSFDWLDEAIDYVRDNRPKRCGRIETCDVPVFPPAMVAELFTRPSVDSPPAMVDEPTEEEETRLELACVST